MDIRAQRSSRQRWHVDGTKLRTDNGNVPRISARNMCVAAGEIFTVIEKLWKIYDGRASKTRHSLRFKYLPFSSSKIFVPVSFTRTTCSKVFEVRTILPLVLPLVRRNDSRVRHSLSSMNRSLFVYSLKVGRCLKMWNTRVCNENSLKSDKMIYY